MIYSTFEQKIYRISKWMEVMRRDGLLVEEALQMSIDDPDMRNRLVQFWNSHLFFDGYKPPRKEKIARAIGIPVFGIEEAVQYFNVKPTRAQFSKIAEIPFTLTELRRCKNTHILVAVFPISILEIRGKDELYLFEGHEIGIKNCWYNNEKFAKEKGQAEWHLIRKAQIENSTGKTWEEQQTLLAKNDRIPAARVMVYTIIGHFLATGEKLFRAYQPMYTSDLLIRGLHRGRISVGEYSDGLSIGCSNDLLGIGITSEKKPSF